MQRKTWNTGLYDRCTDGTDLHKFVTNPTATPAFSWMENYRSIARQSNLPSLMADSNKRQAQSPLSGDEDDLKRRIIMEDPPTLVSLDEISEDESEPTPDTELEKLLGNGGGKEADTTRSAAEKVDCLINRMDKFMECFSSLHSTVSRNQHTNTRKFKRLEQAHNDLATKVIDSSSSTLGRLESLEAKLKESQSENAKLANKLKCLEDDQTRKDVLQRQMNDSNTKRLTALEQENGFINKNMLDCWSEVKERKLIIAGVAENPNEDVSKTALDSINRVIKAAIAMKDPEVNLGGLRKLHRGSIDNVYRIGKSARGPFSRNISVTFLRFDDKDMAIRAKSDIKGDTDIKIFFNEDVSTDGRALKTQLKRIAQVAKTQGKNAKVSGNKVTIDSRSYHSNELSLIPADVTENLKHEKHTDDGIIFKGEKSVFSNFYPAPFHFNGVSFQHVEQYYQHCKATHHNETQTANRIMQMSNPRRIKSLGDNIESNPAWLEQRMMVLYRGIKAKFEQNWPLQDELTSSNGKQLYEATTDRYFGCGISFESTRWARHDWPGENVAGLILMKVREELLGPQAEDCPSNSTLKDIASEDNMNSSASMDTRDNSVLEAPVHNVDVSTATEAGRASSVQQSPSLHKGQADRRLSEWSSYDQTSSAHADVRRDRSFHGSSSMSYDNQLYSNQSYGNQSSSQSRGFNRRGRGRGRGRGSGGNNGRQRYQSSKPRKQQDKMTDFDRNFLCGHNGNTKNKHANAARNSSPKTKTISNPLGLNELQIKGLALLGLNLPPEMANQMLARK